MHAIRRALAVLLAGAFVSGIPALTFADSVAPAPPAGLTAPLGEGDVAVTGFAGVRLTVPSVPAGTDPLSLTAIDPDGTSLRVFDLSTLGGPTVGQVVDAPEKLALPASAIGQVFGLAFDDGDGAASPNLYVAATSAYGLQIVGPQGADGTRLRLKQGAPGAAFMAGQFGSLPGASPGSIFKIDGTTGAVTVFADTAFSGVPDTGAGLGGLAFDPTSHDLYASDLDTGLVHRFNTLAPGADLGQFDHGVTGRPAAGLAAVADDGQTANIANPAFIAADPATWGLTQPERRVEALAAHSGRLYYSVADGPSIWSVGLNADGSFAADPRLELQVAAAQPYPVTGIAFDPAGDMVLAQRGTQASPFDYGQFSGAGAQVLRYAPAPAGSATPWAATPDEYPVGLPDGSRMGAGGVALADSYNPDGSRGTACGATLLATGDDLRDNVSLASQLPPGPANLAGVQLNDASLVAPQNMPPAQSAFIAFDPNASPTATGHAGAVAAVSCLGGSASAAAPAVNPSASTNPSAGTNPAANAQNPTGGGTTAPGTQPGGGGTTANNTQPGGGGATAANQPLTVSKAATATTCTETGGCSFTITVHNPNQSAVPGPFTVQDVFTAGGAQLTQSKLTSGPDAPWTCLSAAAGGSMSCTNPGPIQPGDTPLNLTFAPGQTGAATDVLNCAQPGGPNTTPVNLPPVPPATQPAPAATANQNGLFVAVEPRPAQCKSSDGTCDFDVSAGPAEDNGSVQGPLTFKITASLGADPAPVKFDLASPTFPAGTTCKMEPTGDALDCGTAAGALTSSTNLELPVKTTLPVTGASALVLHASVQGPQAQGDASDSISLTDGTPQGGANPDTGVAQQFLAPQCATIPLDKTKGLANPPASIVNGLSIAKTLSKNPGPCTVGSTCSFDITVTNTTNAAVPGPVSFFDIVEDKITSRPLPPGITETGPFTCSLDSIAVSCTDKDALPAGQSLTETVSVPVTADLLGPAGQNCALVQGGFHPACAPFPAPPNPPSQGLTIKKTGPASCNEGQACEVKIDITNTANTDHAGPIVFTDVGLPDEITIQGGNIATPDAADALVCTPGDPSTCTFDGAIPAGQTQPFGLSFTPTDPGPQPGLENCAMLEGDSADPSCINITMPPAPPPPPAANPPPATPHTGLTLSITPNEASCVAGQPGCSFTVTASNEKLEAVPGPFDIELRPEGDANAGHAVELGTNFDPQSGGSGWTCDPNGGGCRTGTTGPGASVGASANLPPLTASYTIDINSTSPTITVCASSNQSSDTPCATVPVQLPAMLKLDKAPKGGAAGSQGTCPLAGPCDFIVTITNTGAATYTGEPIINDLISPETVSDMHGEGVDNPGAWVCKTVTNDHNGGCIAIQPIVLAPGQSTSIEMDTTPGSVWLKDDIETNCVSFEGADQLNSPIPGAPVDTASQMCASYKLDPFNVQVQKSGDQSCQPGADCHFSLTLFDPGPIDHDAPVTISDKLSAGSAPITSISPPLPCAQQPTQVPFSCTSPGNFPMKVGESHTYNLTIRLPAGAASYTNCAVVGPETSGDANQELGAKPSCVTTTMQPPPAAHLSLKKTGPASCQAGQPCAFSATITNDGNGAFAGKALLSDTLDIGAAPILGGVPVCQTAPTSVPFRCTTTPLTLPPGATSSFGIVLQMPDTTATSATNCAIIEAASKASGERGSNQSCATVALTPSNGTGGSNGTQPQVPPVQQPSTHPGPPHGALLPFGNGGTSGIFQPNANAPFTVPLLPQGTGGKNGIFPGAANAPHQVPISPVANPLTITKTGPASCAPGGICFFNIEITRTGLTSPTQGGIEFDDTLDIGAAQVVSLAPSVCNGTPTQLPIKCDIPHDIVKGQPLSFTVGIRLPSTNATQVTNCASTFPFDELDWLGLFNASGNDPAPVTACATVPLNSGSGGTNGTFQPDANAPHTVPILQAAPAAGAQLSIIKTGDSSCTAGGACNYTLTLLDSSAAPFKGAVEINDQLELGAEHHQNGDATSLAITAIQPPLPCSTQPTQVPFKCDSAGDLTIGSGQQQTYHITTQVSADYTAPTLTNCATVDTAASPDDLPLLQLGLLNGQRPQSCATVAINQPTGNGGTNGTEQQPIAPPAQAPATTAPQPQQCFSNMVPDGKGGCQCPANTFWDGKQCSSGEGGTNGVEPQQDTTPVCPAGTTGTPPACQAIQITPKASAPHQVPILHCPANTTGTYPNCKPVVRVQQVQKCPLGMVGNPPTCSCPTGTHLSSTGRSCVANQQPAETNQRGCPADASGRYPVCRCPPNDRYSRATNTCVPFNQPSTGNGGINFPMGGNFNPTFGGGFNFPTHNGRHPRQGQPENQFPIGGTNGTEQQNNAQPHACPPGKIYSAKVHACVPGGGGTVTAAPTPAPAPAPAPDDAPVDFGACPGCGSGGDIVVK